MRFEVRTGGIVAILFGLTALSGGVFLMGLRAGYDMAHESQADADKVSTDYPLTVTPPSSAASVIAAQTPAANATSGVVEVPVRKGPEPALASNPRPLVAAIERPKPRIEAPAAETSRGAPPDEDEQPAAASTPVSPPSRNVARKPFNIEIQAAMDLTSASQMVRRLHALGYEPHLVPTRINGEPWYKVEVGPYATQAEAADAEAELRQKYNTTYGHGGAPAQAAGAAQGREE
jgi:septal ring-binding cell division protein DamX